MQVSLKVKRGKSAGKEIAIPTTSFLIGRNDECHLRPKSDAISRRHCELRVEDDQVVVEDLGSRNGTIVNGSKISEATVISDGDELRVGKLEFEVVIVHPEPVDSQFDVSNWLEADDTSGTDVKKKLSDPETRQLQLDETAHTKLQEAAAKAEAAATDNGDENEAEIKQTIDAVADEEPSDDTTGFFLGIGKKKEKTEKKKVGKLPTNSGPSTDNSTDAAAETLKNFFNNRS